ncbi:hypothetical protein HS041_08485 [Planomonospora sp. ID67723]|uniref:hypothetical protein n=1 Tax=Planomonospora sp. ID67723 TaxID=2738134 RepID=UPI0018C368F1|nr:hypothetical protein [Planomonospora sp. ID67723]MBG0827800.1 hypothetical protein [Planomonospora sp. ID67723]
MIRSVEENPAAVRRGLFLAAAGALVLGGGLAVVGTAMWIWGVGLALLIVGSVQAVLAVQRAGRRVELPAKYAGGLAAVFMVVMVGVVQLVGAGHAWAWAVPGAAVAAVLVIAALRQGRR